jgi:integrase
MLLQDLWTEYQAAKFPARQTQEGFRSALKHFAEYMGRAPVVDDLTEHNISETLLRLRGAGYRPKSTCTYGDRLNALWNFAYARGHASERRVWKPVPRAAMHRRAVDQYCNKILAELRRKPEGMSKNALLRTNYTSIGVLIKALQAMLDAGKIRTIFSRAKMGPRCCIYVIAEAGLDETPFRSPIVAGGNSRLKDLLTIYLQDEFSDASPFSVMVFRLSFQHFEQFLGRPAFICDLTYENLQGATRSAAVLEQYPSIAARCRDALLALWLFAVKRGEQIAAPDVRAIRSDKAPAVTTNPEIRSLSDLCLEYVARKLTTSPVNTISRYSGAIKNMQQVLGREPVIADLTDENLSEIMSVVLKRNRSKATANNIRKRFIALWNYACRQDYLRIHSETAKLTEAKRVPIAWTRPQLAQLFQECSKQTGHVAGVPAADWWHSLHAVLWDTGERIGAVLAVRWEWIDLHSRHLTIPAEARKGGQNDLQWELHPTTIALLLRIREPARKLVWPFPFDPSTLWNRYKRLLESAGLPSDRKHKFHCMRKSVASYFEAAGGNATALLSHSSRNVTIDSYIDLRVCPPPQASRLLFRPEHEERPNLTTLYVEPKRLALLDSPAEHVD